jgi:outer membrane protein assembly factor BamA
MMLKFPRLFSFIFLLAVVLFCQKSWSQANRFFEPTQGMIRAKDLPEDFRGTVRSIQLDIKDAFDGIVTHSEEERWMYDQVNKLHINSRPGTIRRRLLIREGDLITKDLLLECEKTLRLDEFLADAIIEALAWKDSTVHIKVTTFDQWTTVLGGDIKRAGGKLEYNFGLVESNLLGTGQRLGFYIGHNQLRDRRSLEYFNRALFPVRLQLKASSAWLSDGYSVDYELSKPLESRTDRYAFSAAISALKLTEYVYADANQKKRSEDTASDSARLRAAALQPYKHVSTHDLNLSFTRSYGFKTKFNVIPSFDRHERYGEGRPIPNPRLDYLLGISLWLYQYKYKTVQNFNNLKWSETLNTGWRVSTKLAKNQKWMGSKNSDWYLSHTAIYNNAFWDNFYLNATSTARYFLSEGNGLNNGIISANSEVQWKPVTFTSTYLSTSWNNYFATDKATTLVLGEENGLNGYPNFYYSGQARLLIGAEQRFFPNLEVGTLVPAFAIFGNTGNTFPTYSQFDPNDLHYSLGLGLRLGFSKTVQKLVYHFNLSWPVGEKELSGPYFGLQTKLGL